MIPTIGDHRVYGRATLIKGSSFVGGFFMIPEGTFGALVVPNENGSKNEPMAPRTGLGCPKFIRTKFSQTNLLGVIQKSISVIFGNILRSFRPKVDKNGVTAPRTSTFCPRR